MTATPSKRSTLERRLDHLILIMFLLLACLCLVDAVGAALWVNKVSCCQYKTICIVTWAIFVPVPAQRLSDMLMHQLFKADP